MDVFYERRIILSIEKDPQSNVYNQILLSADQARAVSELIQRFFRSGEPNDVGQPLTILISKFSYNLPEDIKTVSCNK